MENMQIQPEQKQVLCPETQEVIDTITSITNEAAEKKSARARSFPDIQVGDIVRQGDIYIHRVEDNHPHGALLKDNQLAQGSTMGSKHIAEEPFLVYEGTTAPEGVAPKTFLGPCIQTDRKAIISHPEHAHVILPPGTYQITHQMDAISLERVRD